MSTMLPEDEEVVRKAMRTMVARADELLLRLDRSRELLGALLVECPAPRRDRHGLVLGLDDAYARALARANAFYLDELETSL